MSEDPKTPTKRERTPEETAAQIERISGHLIRRAENLNGYLTDSGGSGEMGLAVPAIENPQSATLIHLSDPDKVHEAHNATRAPNISRLERFNDLRMTTKSTVVGTHSTESGKSTLEGGTTIDSKLSLDFRPDPEHTKLIPQESRKEAAKMISVLNDELADREIAAKAANKNSSSR